MSEPSGSCRAGLLPDVIPQIELLYVCGQPEKSSSPILFFIFASVLPFELSSFKHLCAVQHQPLVCSCMTQLDAIPARDEGKASEMELEHE